LPFALATVYGEFRVERAGPGDCEQAVEFVLSERPPLAARVTRRHWSRFDHSR
jgi:hypothetical protein